MATKREIIAALGLREGASTRQAYNAAIRKMQVGGDDLLDALNLVDRLYVRLKERDLPGQREAKMALDSLVQLRDLMDEIIKGRPIQ